MEKEIKELKIFHYAVCFGALLIILVLHLSVRSINLTSLDSKVGMLGFVALGIAAMSLIVGNLIFKKRTDAIEGNEITSENIGEFRAAYILKWAFLEGAILINALFYFFMNESAILIIVALLLLLLLFVSKPNYKA